MPFDPYALADATPQRLPNLSAADAERLKAVRSATSSSRPPQPPNPKASAIEATARLMEASTDRAATCVAVEELLEPLTGLDDGHGGRLPPAEPN